MIVDAYKIGIQKLDDLSLINLMGKTGICLNKLI